ncbi:MAG: 5-formyltetrahydrofolate cyclo-ligase [Gammaproteobacteria bacterium]|nr:5-formyltetrahydrofolate cyclo-ligase [Gammaproteobacteria bacterium]
MEKKNLMRRKAYDARAAQENKDEISENICERFIALPEYQNAKTAMWYIDCRSETRTKKHLQQEIQKQDKKIIVPYCTVDEKGDNKLGLWHLKSFDELIVGKWNILEPPRELWGNPDKEVEPEELDLVMVPGVGFDRSGGRMGNGQGYYDRLLEKARKDCPLIAICYESQLFDEILVGPHDVFMDKVITEEAVYEGKGRD